MVMPLGLISYDPPKFWAEHLQDKKQEPVQLAYKNMFQKSTLETGSYWTDFNDFL